VDREEAGRFFRSSWIKGVKKHYPGEPKESYIKAWEQMENWERESAIAVCQQIQGFILAGCQCGQAPVLTREQGGRLVRIAWVGQMYKHFPDPKPAYVCDWESMSNQWEQEVDMDIFEDIQAAMQAHRSF
jgi:hypothetical protein